LDAKIKLADMKLNYFGEEIEDSIVLYEELQEKKPSKGQFNFVLAEEYRWLDGKENNNNKSFENYKKAALLGNSEAFSKLFHFALGGEGSAPEDIENGNKILKEVFAHNLQRLADINFFNNEPDEYIETIEKSMDLFHNLDLDNGSKATLLKVLEEKAEFIENKLKNNEVDDLKKELLGSLYSSLGDIYDKEKKIERAIPCYGMAYLSDNTINPMVKAYFASGKYKKEVTALVKTIREDYVSDILKSKSVKTKFQNVRRYYQLCKSLGLKDYSEDFLKALDEIQDSFYSPRRTLGFLDSPNLRWLLM